MTFYHGTSDALDIERMILPPEITGNQREEWRKKYHDKVFFTSSLLSAEKYAKKACNKYGGSPIIYTVKPIGEYYKRIDYEYVADKALVTGKEKIYRGKQEKTEKNRRTG